MKIIKVFLLVFAFACVFFAGFYINKIVFTGQAVKDVILNYTWTRAVCNGENECLDVIITCENGKVAGIEPIFYKIKHESNWSDFRNSSFC